MRYESPIVVDIKCPYFRSETAKGLNCEGCLQGSERMKTSFLNEDDKSSYIASHCFEYPNTCIIAITNDSKYT